MSDPVITVKCGNFFCLPSHERYSGTAHCSFRCCGWWNPIESLSKFRDRSHCSDHQAICKYSSSSRAVRPTINFAKSFVGTRGVRG